MKERVADGVCVLGLRFPGDVMSPAERFGTLRRELGDGFVAVEIDSSPGNPWGFSKRAHSVLTEELVDEPGNPTREALEQVLDLFRTPPARPACVRRLLAAPGPGRGPERLRHSAESSRLDPFPDLVPRRVIRCRGAWAGPVVGERRRPHRVAAPWCGRGGLGGRVGGVVVCRCLVPIRSCGGS